MMSKNGLQTLKWKTIWELKVLFMPLCQYIWPKTRGNMPSLQYYCLILTLSLCLLCECSPTQRWVRFIPATLQRAWGLSDWSHYQTISPEIDWVTLVFWRNCKFLTCSKISHEIKSVCNQAIYRCCHFIFNIGHQFLLSPLTMSMRWPGNVSCVDFVYKNVATQDSWLHFPIFSHNEVDMGKYILTRLTLVKEVSCHL